MADGGRLQILDRARPPAADPPPQAASAAAGPPVVAEAETWDEEEVAATHWREDKVGLLLTMHSAASATDPCPEIPPSFVDATRIPELVRDLSRHVKQAADAAAAAPDPG